MEQALRDALIPALLQGLGEETLRRGVTHLPMKQAGLALTDQTKMAPENWTESCVITGHLVAAIMVQEEFRTANRSA